MHRIIKGGPMSERGWIILLMGLGTVCLVIDLTHVLAWWVTR